MVVDPATLSDSEKERLVRAYIQIVWKNIGPRIDVPAPDVGTTPQMMGWMMDEYSMLAGQYTPGVITGKPVGGGGSLGRKEATGYGVIFTVREALKHLGIDSSQCKAAIQGFGNVAQFAAIGFIEKLKGTVVCVSYWDRDDRVGYTVTKETGIDPHFLLSITDQYGSIDKNKAREAGYHNRTRGCLDKQGCGCIDPLRPGRSNQWRNSAKNKHTREINRRRRQWTHHTRSR